jgi:hypothetical protein
MKLKVIAALLVVGMGVSACLLQGVTAGAVLGFIASNASKAGEAALVLQEAIARYKESETRLDKIRVLVDVSCHFRKKHPNEMVFLREKLNEAGVSAKMVEAARNLADKKCGPVAQIT